MIEMTILSGQPQWNLISKLYKIKIRKEPAFIIEAIRN